jgi:glucose/mannose-6-phosphate isomerase
LLVTRGTLDDRASLDAFDRSGMLALAGGLGRQLRTGFEAAAALVSAPQDEARSSLPPTSDVTGVVVCGMGGSGIAGDVVRSLMAGSAQVPVAGCKGYILPGSCGPGTLVVAVSYSGNTEETLAAYEAAVARGCAVVSISAGGALAERAARTASPHVTVPSDVPMPRAAVGYLAGAALGVVDAIVGAGTLSDELEPTVALLDDLAARLGPDRPLLDNEAKELALWLAGRIPVVWGSEGLAEAAALRWKNQLNENAKIPAFSSLLPELDHNEIEGWGATSGVPFGLIVLRHGAEHPRIADRVDASLGAIGASALSVRQVGAEGSSPLANLFSLMMKADFASIYLAALRGVDPTPVPVLTGLKERLRQ